MFEVPAPGSQGRKKESIVGQKLGYSSGWGPSPKAGRPSSGTVTIRADLSRYSAEKRDRILKMSENKAKRG